MALKLMKDRAIGKGVKKEECGELKRWKKGGGERELRGKMKALKCSECWAVPCAQFPSTSYCSTKSAYMLRCKVQMSRCFWHSVSNWPVQVFGHSMATTETTKQKRMPNFSEICPVSHHLINALFVCLFWAVSCGRCCNHCVPFWTCLYSCLVSSRSFPRSVRVELFLFFCLFASNSSYWATMWFQRSFFSFLSVVTCHREFVKHVLLTRRVSWTL